MLTCNRRHPAPRGGDRLYSRAGQVRLDADSPAFPATACVRAASARNLGALAFQVVLVLVGKALMVVAVVSPLGLEALSLISLRRASPMERRLYEQNT